MPKAPLKNKAKLKAKSATSKRKAPALKKKIATAKPDRGFMWKVLKQKQEQRKQLQMNGTNVQPEYTRAGPNDPGHASRGFGRFNGSRRKAA